GLKIRPRGRLIILVPNANRPEGLLGRSDWFPVVADEVRLIGNDFAAVPQVGRERRRIGSQFGTGEDVNLIGGLMLVALRTDHFPREPRLGDINAERIACIFTTEFGWAQVCRKSLCSEQGKERN